VAECGPAPSRPGWHPPAGPAPRSRREASVTSVEQFDSDLEIRAYTPPPGPGSEFVQEFTRHQRRLYLYILAQVGRPTDAEDILQQTNLVIWRKADQFVPGTSFFAWSSRIATFEVLKHRERRGREKLRFSPEIIEVIAEEAADESEQWEERRKALSICLRKLRPRDRELIERRYAPGENGKSVAEDLGRPVNAVYQSLGRIRRALLECVNRQLAMMTGQ
jgi:RNA polymerase sigma-70 factor (ECF subfamily)